MFFSKVLLFAVSLGALSVLATPHALHHHALHRRAVAARVASARTNATDVTVKRQNSPKCNHHPPSSAAPSSSIIPSPPPIIAAPNTHVPSTTPNPTPPTSTTPPKQQPPTTTPTAPAPGPTSPGLTGGPFFGDGTFFATGLGACGITNVDTDFIVAVSHFRFDSFPGYNGADSNTNGICGKKVVINVGSATATATVTDRCGACLQDDLDMTTSLFSVFANLDLGRIKIEWNFV